MNRIIIVERRFIGKLVSQAIMRAMFLRCVGVMLQF